MGERCKEGEVTSVKRSKLHVKNDWTYFVFKVHPSVKQFSLRLKIYVDLDNKMI